ncbi:MAG: helix-turn-helix transcriptional regulator [Bacteroidales bacterium]|nr:helix-turn-helix transcriptional regulator [Bacteroidales bacterium]
MVENNIGNKVENAVNDIFGFKLGKKQKGQAREAQIAPEETQAVSEGAQAASMQQAQGEAVKNDFVPGTVVLFEDHLSGEQMGEFPSRWDLISNNAEVARMNGRMAIKFEHGSDTKITPLSGSETPAFTEQEKNIARLLSPDGKSTEEIAQTVQLSVNTVLWYRKRLYATLDVHSAAALITELHRRGLVE